MVAVAVGCVIAPTRVARNYPAMRDMGPITHFSQAWPMSVSDCGHRHGVVRVVLLCYMAPVWTVPLAWLMLGEAIDCTWFWVIAIAMFGALVMLWRPELGAPLPKNGYRWIALAAGFSLPSRMLVAPCAGGERGGEGLGLLHRRAIDCHSRRAAVSNRRYPRGPYLRCRTSC